MRVPSPATLLDVWETSSALPLAQRMLVLLRNAQPEWSYAALEEMPLGERDAQLLTLREQLFGIRLVSVANCPTCGERVQSDLDTRTLRVNEHSSSKSVSFTHAAYAIDYRLPNSSDLLALAEYAENNSPVSVEASRALLLERCIQSVQANGETQRFDVLPTETLDEIVARMAQCDPQADIQLALHCPACEHEWLAAFDIAAFLWSEINAWAQRVLREVHVIASAYGWSQNDILNLSATRRGIYLDMIDSG